MRRKVRGSQINRRARRIRREGKNEENGGKGGGRVEHVSYEVNMEDYSYG
jgi:hypothetical protein